MKTTIIILATLHLFHLNSSVYSLEHLRTNVEKINPDVICVELTAKDLKEKSNQAVKIEYPKCILPLAQEKGYMLIPMEPDEPEYSELVDRVNKNLISIEPERREIFSRYTKLLYDFLFAYWDSPMAVNSQLTNALFEIKHNFQNFLFGPIEEECWERWNTHFLNKVMEASEAHKGKKILVTVGVEHVYWLKMHLRATTGIELIEAP